MFGMRREQGSESGGRRFLRGLFRGVKILFLLVIILASGVLVYSNLPAPKAREDVTVGVTFSYRQAEALGLDWKETYTAILDDLGARHIRIPVYWDTAEPQENEFDYSVVDWELQEAAKRGAEVILVVGQRVPRWPECHIPGWVPDDAPLRESALLDFIDKTIDRYKNLQEITVWQVENEPFLSFFGECPPLEKTFLDTEIDHVRRTDPSRPILITDSGELSLWYDAAKRGDIFGTTLYRDIYKEGVGYYRYPIGPNFFRLKRWIVERLTGQKHFIVAEMQAEPWGPGWIGDMPLGEQFKTMNEYQLRETFDYAREIGFGEVYMWGAEWWYWLKTEKQYPNVWSEAKDIFKEFSANGERRAVRINGAEVMADIADDSAEREKGLSGRKYLAEGEGMLFVFPFERQYSFWMKDMLIPIDIIWISADGKVVSIKKNLSPDTFPEAYTSQSGAKYVLEVSSGWADRHGVKVGDAVNGVKR